MYRCDDCGELFTEPRFISEETGVTADLGAFGSMSEVVDYEICPHCGSEDFTDAPECACCGESEVTMFDADYCENCIEDAKSVIAIAMDTFLKQHPKADEDMFYDMMYVLWEKHDERLTAELQKKMMGAYNG